MKTPLLTAAQLRQITTNVPPLTDAQLLRINYRAVEIRPGVWQCQKYFGTLHGWRPCYTVTYGTKEGAVAHLSGCLSLVEQRKLGI